MPEPSERPVRLCPDVADRLRATAEYCRGCGEVHFPSKLGADELCQRCTVEGIDPFGPDFDDNGNPYYNVFTGKPGTLERIVELAETHEDEGCRKIFAAILATMASKQGGGQPGVVNNQSTS